MKKQLAIALTAALLAFPVTPGLALAETSTATDTTPPASGTTVTNSQSSAVVDANGQTVNPGILPDSPWYWFQTMIEKIQLALTFDPVKKADLVERQAVERLAEAQALIKEGKVEEAEKTLTAYSTKIEEAQNFLEQVKDPNSETSQKVQAVLTQVNAKNMIVLGSLLEKLPPQAAQKLALNIVRTVEKAVAKAEKKQAQTQTQTQTAANGTDTANSTANTVTNSSGTATGKTINSNSGEVAQAGPQDQAQLGKQAQQALEELRVALGLKKDKNVPNGEANGYYKHQNQTQTQQQTQVQQLQQESQTQTQQQLQQQAQTQTQTQTQQQYQARQAQPAQPALNPAPKKQGDEDRNEDHGKEQKEKDKGRRE